MPASISPSPHFHHYPAQCVSVSVHISGSMSIIKRRQQQNNVRDDVVASHRSRAYVVCIFEILVTQPQPQQSVTFTTRLSLPSATPLPPPLPFGIYILSIPLFSVLLWLIYWFPFRLSSPLPLLCIGICRVYLTSHSPETRHHKWVTSWRQSLALSLSLSLSHLLSLSFSFTLVHSLSLYLFPCLALSLCKCAYFFLFLIVVQF